MPTQTTYSYPVAAFSNGAALSALEETISKSPAIVVGCLGTTIEAGVVSFVFKDVLDSSSKEALDGDSTQAPNETPPSNSILGAHDGVELITERLDKDGNMVVAPTFLHSSNTARLKGYKITAPAGETVIHDVEVTSQLLVQGGQFWIMGSGPDDYVEFVVCDKNGVIPFPSNPAISLMTALGLTPGVDVLELTKYVDPLHIPEIPFFQDNIIMPTVAPVVNGLFLRTIYHNTGLQDAKMSLTYRWYEA